MNLPKLTDTNVSGKKVLVRADLDIGKDLKKESEKLKTLLPTLEYVYENQAEITMIGHRGRPGGKKVESLSLKPVSKTLEEILTKELGKDGIAKLNMYVMENLRFNPGEEKNDSHFAEHLAENKDLYINEAFSTSHREHASIVGLPKYLPHVAGFRFSKEVENLSRVLTEPKTPVVVVLGGFKKDKIKYINGIKDFADKILIAGRLPDYLPEDFKDEKVKVAHLMQDKEDITIHSMEKFEQVIANAGTIVLSGPAGKFEDEGHKQGTQRVFTAIAHSNAYKVAGGGDTQDAILMFDLKSKFDWISVGGGAMLEFLTKKTLPGIKALLE